MSDATQTKDIDGLSFSVTKLPPMKSLRMLNRLRRCVGPALGKMLGAVGGKGLGDMDVSRIGEALEALNLPDQELEDITRELLAATFVTVDGKTGQLLPQMDMVLLGKVGTLMKVLGFALVVNYGSFWQDLRALAPARATGPSPSPSA